jgi:hypothetical protein
LHFDAVINLEDVRVSEDDRLQNANSFRDTAEVLRLTRAGVVAVTEPAFWAGFDRGSAQAFRGYFDQLTVYEPKRAAQFGVKHYTWMCLNPKEAEDLKLAEEVLSFLPEYLDRPTVLGVGEIGLNKNSKNELLVLERHIELACRCYVETVDATCEVLDDLGQRVRLDRVMQLDAVRHRGTELGHLAAHDRAVVAVEWRAARRARELRHAPAGDQQLAVACAEIRVRTVLRERIERHRGSPNASR